MYVHSYGVFSVSGSRVAVYIEVARHRKVDRVSAGEIFERVARHALYSHISGVFGVYVAQHLLCVDADRQRIGIINLTFDLINIEFVTAAVNGFLICTVESV